MIKKYKCLVLDHDDTVVNSSASIHYPSFVEYLKIARPHLADKYTLEEYFEKNFQPGILELFTEEIGLNEQELAEEEAFWREYVKNHIPTAYPGMKEIIAEFKARGGIVAVDSHSVTENIVRDYKANGLPEPDIIYGWDIPKEMRKPAPGTLLDLMEKYSLAPDEILVVDDLKPGYDMARAAGVDIAAAAWAHNVPEIASFMEKNCEYFCRSVEELRRVLFD
ncbi:MAG: HAD family phosphatase [Clostridia bacterium]|nr:HAD family phosphatase [Clostridia bacterium]